MAVYHPHEVTCNQCGFKFTAQLAKGINIGRSPELKQKIIDGTFHKVSCPNCNTTATVEKEFSYTDFTTNTFIKVKPRTERHLWKDASLKLEHEIEVVPEALLNNGEKKLRVVFGMAELREKVLAQEVGLDDRMIELLKVFVIHEHPFLIQKSLIRISFDSITEEAITFSIQYDHQNKEFMVSIPRWIAEDLLAREDEMRDWVKRNHSKSNIFDTAHDHWVNIWRWSPQPSALDQLKNYAEKIRHEIPVNTNAQEFQTMLSYLPKGTHLPSWGKDALNVLFQYAKKIGDSRLQDSLFEIRFDKILEDDWAYNNDPNDIDTLWKLLSDLPSSNIDGNSFIREIIYDQGTGGGAYNPQTYDIYIGSDGLSNGEYFEDTVRHEVGHAVHEKFANKVNAWLTNEFGWQTFSANSASDINTWVSLMGGWGNLTPVEISQVRNYLIEALGPGGRWTPSRPNFVPPNHPWFKSDFGPRLAFENTKEHWYSNLANWYQFDNKAFFLNYWYRTLCVVNVSTLELIRRMPSNYAAMSHFEFFAELYALYFDKDDPSASSIPPDVSQWLKDNIDIDSAVMPASPTLQKKDFEWVSRPR
jgi:hypothetical protein